MTAALRVSSLLAFESASCTCMPTCMQVMQATDCETYGKYTHEVALAAGVLTPLCIALCTALTSIRNTLGLTASSSVPAVAAVSLTAARGVWLFRALLPLLLLLLLRCCGTAAGDRCLTLLPAFRSAAAATAAADCCGVTAAAAAAAAVLRAVVAETGVVTIRLAVAECGARVCCCSLLGVVAGL
eukprot:2129-Heterococcus_DN1.PRE.1